MSRVQHERISKTQLNAEEGDDGIADPCWEQIVSLAVIENILCHDRFDPVAPDADAIQAKSAI